MRKETAFEALEDVLREAGRLRRPSPSDYGFQAVIHAICLWKDFKWTHFSNEEQASLLETHSSWRNYRRKRGLSPDIDEANFSAYKVELRRLLRAEHLASAPLDGGGGGSGGDGGDHGDSRTRDAHQGGTAGGGAKLHIGTGSCQRRKEAAFEALEQALGGAGRERRPSAADKGYAAVTQAICFWKKVGAWEDLAPEEQTASLKALSYWTTSRRKRGVPHPDIDRGTVESFKPRLAILLAKNASHAPPPQASASSEPVASVAVEPLAPTPAPPISTPLPSPAPLLLSSFSGGARAFGNWTKLHYPAERQPPSKRKRQTDSPAPGYLRCGPCFPKRPGGAALVVRHFVAGATSGDSHLDFIDQNGRMVCRHRSSCEVDPSIVSMPSCSCEEVTITSASSSSPSNRLSPSSLALGNVTVRHNSHHDVLVPTNAEGTEFAVVCPERREIAAASEDSAELGMHISPCGGNMMTDVADPASLLEWCDSIKLIADSELDAISGMLCEP